MIFTALSAGKKCSKDSSRHKKLLSVLIKSRLYLNCVLVKMLWDKVQIIPMKLYSGIFLPKLCLTDIYCQKFMLDFLFSL